ncbi:hypothetical protein AW101_25385, partial [Escherichia coli]
MRKLTFELRSPIHQQNAIQAIQQILPDPTKPIVVTIQERNRSIRQNARLHAMLSEISKKATYHGKARNIEFWKGLFVSGWQIATNQHPEIISGLEGELINIRVNRPGFPGECFICELRLPDHCFRWKHNKLFLLLPEEYGPAFPA